MAQSLNISTLNCRGLKDYKKRDFIINYLNSNSVDVCFLQETHCASLLSAKTWSRKWGGKTFWSFGSERSKGVGIWFKQGLNFKIIHINRDNEGRLLCLLVKVNNHIFKLVNVYAPIIPRERKQFFQSFKHVLKGKHHIILGGDFNCVVDISLDKSGGNDIYGNLASQNLVQVCNDHNLIDIFRKLHPHEQSYTWRNSLHNIFCRLDRFYISDSLIPNVTYISQNPISNTISDHYFVNFEIKLNEANNQNTGPGYRKCNTSILQDIYFKENFQGLWLILESMPNHDSNWWEHCKSQFKQLIMCHAKRLANIKHSELKTAKLNLKRLIQRAENQDTTPNLLFQIKQAQDQLDQLNDQFLEGAKIRSKAKFLDTDEKPTRFFLQKEKKSATDKYIKILTKDDGEPISTNTAIIEECSKFYENLYSTKIIDPSLNDYFLHDIPKLSEESSDLCEGEITLEECTRALKQMQNNKSPGPDGLPAEFYIFAFPLIGKEFVKLLNRVWLEGTLPLTQRQCLITLICKDKNNADRLSNWRPISLLNCDYKILSKTLSSRLSKVLEEIIHPDQTCSIPGRTIQDNLHLIRNLIEYSNDKNTAAAILSLDQSKAFDRVSHEYLFNVLHSFGFGPQFISLVKLLYTDIYSSVLVNGYVGREFPVSCSVRQGCSLSPLLYVLSIEPLAHRIRLDPMIKGISIPGSLDICKISQYADDTNLFVSDENSVRQILILVELYGHLSGAKLNKQKTFGMWLGKWRGRTDQPFELQWTNNCKKIYGIFLGHTEGENKTWEKVVTKLEKCVNLYSSRDLSLRGRSIILNVVLCSSIWYVGSLIVMPESILKRLNKLIFNFLWNGKPEAIKRETLYNSFDKGGLNVVDIKSKLESFRILQILSLIKGTKSKWKYFAVYWIGLHLRKYVSAFASLSIPHSEKIPAYYKQALSCFRQFEKLCPDFTLRQTITTKFIYYNVLQTRTISPKVLTVHPTMDFSQIWKAIQCSFVDPRYRDLAWRIAHQIIPTQNLLFKYNISRNAKCYLCKQRVETLCHLFYECSMLDGLWAYVASIFICKVTISMNIILFNKYTPHANKHFNELLLLLVNLLKFCIWTKRNQAKHEMEKVTILSIKALFVRTLTLRIKADFYRLENTLFAKYWGRNNTIACVEGNKIKVLLRLHPP